MRIARIAAEIDHQFQRRRFLRLFLDDGGNSFQEFILLARFDHRMAKLLEQAHRFHSLAVRDHRFNHGIERSRVLMAARELLAGAIGGFLGLAGLDFEVQQHLRYFAARVRFGMGFEQCDGVVILAARDERFGAQEHGRPVRRIDFNRALDKLFRFVVLAAIEQALGVVQIGLGRFLLLAHHVVKLGQPHLYAQVFRLDVEQAVQHFDGTLRVIRFQVRFGNLQEKRTRFAEHSLLDVEVGEAFERRQFIRRQLGNFFVDRDGFAVEAVVEIHLREALEVLDSVRHIALAGIEVADRHQCGLILRVVAENLLILSDGLRDFALIEELQRVFERFAFVERHG